MFAASTLDKLPAPESCKSNINLDNCCWICEGWIEHCFKLDLGSIYKNIIFSDNLIEEVYNVFIHFDFDDWEGDLIED